MIFNGLTNDDKDKLRKAITSDNIGSQSVANATKVNNHTVNIDVPANAVFTDTNTWRPLGTTADTACAGNDSRLSDSRTPKSHTHTKSEVGLGNVDNTADANKSVKYATSAGSVTGSAKVVISSTAPSDTGALWVN